MDHLLGMWHYPRSYGLVDIEGSKSGRYGHWPKAANQGDETITYETTTSVVVPFPMVHGPVYLWSTVMFRCDLGIQRRWRQQSWIH